MFTQAIAKISSIQGCEPIASTIVKFAEYHLLTTKAMSCFYLGKISDAKMEHGLKVVCLRYCCQILRKKQVQNLLGKASFTTFNSVQHTLSKEAFQLYEQYQKQNAMVYHEREPDWNNVHFDSERLLVKSIPLIIMDKKRTNISEKLQELRQQGSSKQSVPIVVSHSKDEDKKRHKSSRNRKVVETCTE